jgi:hypothetical protein
MRNGASGSYQPLNPPTEGSGEPLFSATHSCAAPAVPAAHQVRDLALDLGSGGPVVGDPVRIALSGPSSSELPFIGADGDGASVGRGGALLAQRAVCAVGPEADGAGPVAVAPDRGGVPGGTARPCRHAG